MATFAFSSAMPMPTARRPAAPSSPAEISSPISAHRAYGPCSCPNPAPITRFRAKQNVSPKGDDVRAWNFTDWGQTLPVDLKLDEARPQDFDALPPPSGVSNPDKLRMIPAAVGFVKAFFDAGKPVAAICQAPWTIIEADKARGRRMTSWPSLRTDLRNAGADVVDQEAVVHGNADSPAAGRNCSSACLQGNKRISFVSRVEFLIMNGYDLAIEDLSSWAGAVTELVEHRSAEEDFMRAIRSFVVPNG
jgi:putative intracellular protease/amidase